MGYTHYWTRKQAEIPLDKWNQICDILRPILETPCSHLEDLAITDAYIFFNGTYETFVLQRIEEETPCYTGGTHFFSFCKTNRHDYDEYVVACLLVADKILKGDPVGFSWSSDGTSEEHEFGRDLVKDFLEKAED